MKLAVCVLAVATLTGCAASDRWVYGYTDPQTGVVYPPHGEQVVQSAAAINPTFGLVAALGLSIYGLFRPSRTEASPTPAKQA